MRPVDKGAAPGEYAKYQDAGLDLQQCIGDYCNYCERQIETHLAVEHIQPKSLVADLQNSWSNFLLACVNCNSCKGDTEVNLGDFFWPDCDNTLLVLDYTRGGIVCPNPTMPDHIKNKAQSTIKLVGLDKDPGNPDTTRRPTSSDRRWLRRQQVWELAELDCERLKSNDSPEVRELIVDNAISRGMFSIWWTVFADDVDMRRRLRQAFVGTDNSCFDPNENLQTRVGGQV
jgi:uncharacterized protein (TIGR02646 family)